MKRSCTEWVSLWASVAVVMSVLVDVKSGRAADYVCAVHSVAFDDNLNRVSDAASSNLPIVAADLKAAQKVCANSSVLAASAAAVACSHPAARVVGLFHQLDGTLVRSRSSKVVVRSAQTGRPENDKGVVKMRSCSEVGDSLCGDGIRQAGEMCDGANLGGLSCQSIGLTAGNLGCVGCRLDVSGCGNTVSTTSISVDGTVDVPSAFELGILHGISYLPTNDYSTAVDRIGALNPKTWYLGPWSNDIYGFVVDAAGFPQSQGTEVIFGMQDAFSFVTGGFRFYLGAATMQGGSLRPECVALPRSCWADFSSLLADWTNIVEITAATLASQQRAIDGFEIFAEPDFSWIGVSPAQLQILFQVGHDIVLQHFPQASIVGPSLGTFNPGGTNALTDTLDFVLQENIQLDVVNWHELGSLPEAVLAHTAEVRDFFTSHPQICDPTCPAIEIGEYNGSQTHLIPGNNVGWLYYLHEAGVDIARRACWDVPQGWSTCWAGFGGLLMNDNVTPTNNYWVYKAFAEMPRLLAVATVDPHAVALASKDGADQTVSVLIGRYGSLPEDPLARDLTLVIRDYPFPTSSLQSRFLPIVDGNNQPTAMPELTESFATGQVEVVGNDVLIIVPGFRRGDGLLVTLAP